MCLDRADTVTGVVGVTGVGQGAAGAEEGDHGTEPLGAGPGGLPELPLRRLLSDHQG